MPEADLHHLLTWTEIGLGAVTFVALFFVTAPYGRTLRDGWGPTVPSRVGWVLMEAPALLVWLGIYLTGDHRFEAVPLILLGLWQLHYFHRVVIYPLRMRMKGKRMPRGNSTLTAQQIQVVADWISSIRKLPPTCWW